MKLDQLKTLFGEFDENVRFEHDLKKKNWFNIGGKTKVFFKANNLHELIKFLKKVNNQEKIFTHNNIDFYDDYAHHPTEIKVVLDGVNKVYKVIIRFCSKK